MHARQIDYRYPSADWGADPPIASLFPAKVYKSLASQLGKDRVHWLQDVTTADGEALTSLYELKQRHNIRVTMRKWYIELCKVVCTQDDEEDAVGEALEIEDIALGPELTRTTMMRSCGRRQTSRWRMPLWQTWQSGPHR